MDIKDYNQLSQLSVQELYEVARKKGVRHNDSMSKEELLEVIARFEEESMYQSPETNPYAAMNPDITGNNTDYLQMSIQELYELARKKGITYDYSLNRESMIELLQKHQEAEISCEEDEGETTGSPDIELCPNGQEYQQMEVQELYELVRKKGIRHNDGMNREELIEMICLFDKENICTPDDANPYSVRE